MIASLYSCAHIDDKEYDEDNLNENGVSSMSEIGSQKMNPIFKEYVIQYYHSKLNKEKRDNFLYDKKPTIVIFISNNFSSDIGLSDVTSLPLSSICLRPENSKYNYFGINKDYWESLNNSAKKSMFQTSYDACRYHYKINTLGNPRIMD